MYKKDNWKINAKKNDIEIEGTCIQTTDCGKLDNIFLNNT
jgi:hypothetical protein